MIGAVLLSMLTTFSEGTFHTRCADTAWADMGACSRTVDTLIHYIQAEPTQLSTWPFAGCGHQEDTRRDAVYVVWKDSEYDAQRQYSKLKLDVWADGKPKLRNVSVESCVSDTLIHGERVIRVDIFYSGMLLKKAYGCYTLTPLDTQRTRMAIEVHMKFGWFFRIFISAKVYGQTIDWRVERFMRNMALKAAGITPDDRYWNNKALPNR